MARPRGMSQAEFERRFAIMESKQTTQPVRRRKKSVVDEDPDYDNMSIEEFGGHIQSTSQDCMELGISSGFRAARAFDRGDYIEGTVETCQAVVGVASVVAIVAQLFGASSGRR